MQYKSLFNRYMVKRRVRPLWKFLCMPATMRTMGDVHRFCCLSLGHVKLDLHLPLYHASMGLCGCYQLSGRKLWHLGPDCWTARGVVSAAGLKDSAAKAESFYKFSVPGGAKKTLKDVFNVLELKHISTYSDLVEYEYSLQQLCMQWSVDLFDN